RDFFSAHAFDPEDLSRSWPALFVTRWVTHFCAPAFFFLAGTGAFLYGTRRSPEQVRRFLWTRGLWLILLEFTLVGAGWTFVVPWGFFGVIACLGSAMILLSLQVRLRLSWIAGLNLGIIVLHDLFDQTRLPPTAPSAWVWGLAHVKGNI